MSTQITQEVIPPIPMPVESQEVALPVNFLGSKWNSYDFTDGKIGVLTGVWEFDFATGIRDPKHWNGTWNPIKSNDDRIRMVLHSFDGSGVVDSYDLVFLNESWLVALKGNKLLRLCQRIE